MPTRLLRLRSLRQACRWRPVPIIPMWMLISGMVFLFAASAARARTRDGGGANGNLSLAANWNPDGVPGINADVIFGGVVRLTPSANGKSLKE